MGCGGHGKAAWPEPNGDVQGTRSALQSSIDAADVGRLRVAWRFSIPIRPRESGVAAATPVVGDGVVYLQDLESNVYALRESTGQVLWRRQFNAGNPGPNGLALDGDTVVGSTDTTVFALATSTGRVRWTHRILTPHESFVDIAPLVAGHLVYTATTGYGPGTRGAVYALDERTGATRWKFDTIAGPWAHPDEAGGGGAWETPTLSNGVLYIGTGNPLPWGGSRSRPNGGAYAGPARWTDSLLALDAKTGAVRFGDQVTPHDVRDHDFQNPPIVAGDLVIGSGKSGRVIAWRGSRRVWEQSVGTHRNDHGPLPVRITTVCPGLLGGVETPAAVAHGRVFVPVVDLCYAENAIGTAATSFTKVDPATGRGRLVALRLDDGHVEWQRRLPSPVFGCATVSDDVVLTSTYDGTLYAFRTSDGTTLWRAKARAGVNACPAVADGRMFVAAGVRNRKHAHLELVSYEVEP
ncbi:MAG TPA: PQQ-binding-like beta-propeller repeat protein [Gaiellaceae bacterium]